MFGNVFCSALGDTIGDLVVEVGILGHYYIHN